MPSFLKLLELSTLNRNEWLIICFLCLGNPRLPERQRSKDYSAPCWQTSLCRCTPARRGLAPHVPEASHIAIVCVSLDSFLQE
ncbi:hypothetical protein BJX63DRAFT_408749 [Aspergillus granulosus]|uniref:Uncharacterized protein n=1 Tax=Aspergillus granulosus TaxID=176169 RepID=A0ABR4GZN2_9EURO